ncbi:MAG: LysR family transcriptional regulator [Rhodobacteraceae bacterium]|nr:LysR family transcriptional regulator [Paracoccaceae bacterium]
MPHNNFLNRGLKLTHLQLVATISRTGGMQSAATQLAISQPAASRLASEIERIVGQKIHRRIGKGIELTPAGHALAERAIRVLRELEDAQRDIAEIGQGLIGNVRIGSVTGPAVKYVLPVLREARLAMPKVSISVEVATSDVLGGYLARGELDFVLGRLPEGYQPSMFDTHPIAVEPVSFIARKEHALLRSRNVTAEQLLEYDWVLPFKGTILHSAISRALNNRGLSLPTQTYNTSSFLLTMALTQKSNAIAPIATSVTNVFAAKDAEASLGVIETDFVVQVETFGFLKLAGRVFSPVTQAVYEMLQKIVRAA